MNYMFKLYFDTFHQINYLFSSGAPAKIVFPCPNWLKNHCCLEDTRITDIMAEVNITTCIIEHPGFNFVCLDTWVLDTAYYHYRQQYKVDMVTKIGNIDTDIYIYISNGIYIGILYPQLKK